MIKKKQKAKREKEKKHSFLQGIREALVYAMHSN